jgi:hypothetical protein
MFIRASVDMTSQVYIMMALLLAGLIVLVNRALFPGFRLFIDYGAARGCRKFDMNGVANCPCASQRYGYYAPRDTTRNI